MSMQLRTIKVPPVLNTYHSVRRSANFLLSLFQLEANFMLCLGNWIARVGPSVLKLQMARQLYEASRRADSHRERLRQLRTPQEWIAVPEAGFCAVFDRIDAAPDFPSAYAALYHLFLPRLRRDYLAILAGCDPLFDEPSFERIGRGLAGVEAALSWAREIGDAAVRGHYASGRNDAWLAGFAALLDTAPLMLAHGDMPRPRPEHACPRQTGFWPRRFDPLPRSVKDPRYRMLEKNFVLPPTIARDQDLTKPGGVANRLHRMLPFEYSTLEACSRNMFEHHAMPWPFYLDMARITLDEARHAEMVIQRLNELGSDVGDYPLPPWTAYEIVMSDDLAGRLLKLHRILEGDALDLYVGRVEILSEWDPESARLYDFIEADEIGHVLLGQRWFFHLMRDDVDKIRGMTETAWSEVAPKWLGSHAMLSAWAAGEDPAAIAIEDHGGETFFTAKRAQPVSVLARGMAHFSERDIAELVAAADHLAVEF